MPTRSSLVARCGATLLLVIFAAACSSGAAASPAGAQGPTLAAGATAAPASQGQAQQAGAGSVNDGTLSATNQVVTATQISGLGDKAFSGPLGLEALFGNVSISVTNAAADAVAETLIRTLQPKF